MCILHKYTWERCTLICQRLSFLSELHTHAHSTKILFLTRGPLLSCLKHSIAPQCRERRFKPTPHPGLSPPFKSLTGYLVTTLAVPRPMPQPQQTASCFPKGLQLPCLSSADHLPGLHCTVTFSSRPQPQGSAPFLRPSAPLLSPVKISSPFPSSWLRFWDLLEDSLP